MPKITINGRQHWVPLWRYLAQPFFPAWRGFLRFAHRPLNQTAAFTGITVALVLVAYTFPSVIPGPAAPPPPAGWTTFRQASNLIAPTLQQTRGGPWSLTLAEGVASASPWSPALSMWTANATVLSSILACQSYLSGPGLFTFWSPSLYPAATNPRSFASGAAGLWTFVFQNPYGHSLVLSVLGGSVVTNGLVDPGTACHGLGGPFAPTTSYLNLANATDPTQFAANSYSWISSGESPSNLPSTAFYILGNPVVPVAYVEHGYNQEWSAYYGSCGSPGVNGFVTYSGAPQSIPTRPGYVEELTFGSYCYQSMAGVTGVHKVLSGTNTTFYAQWPLQVTLATSSVQTGRAPALTTGVFGLDVLLNSSNGPYSLEFNSGTPNCSPGALSISACTAANNSWYAALVTPNGVVLDTFPSYGGGDNWTLGTATVVSGDSLVLVSSVPLFSLPNSGVAFETGLSPFVCCGMNFGPTTLHPGPVQL
jgi:hypothetical protein